MTSSQIIASGWRNSRADRTVAAGGSNEEEEEEELVLP